MAKFTALLRGINLGKRTVKMDVLRKLLEENGFSEVKTLLASGNVVFASKDSDAGKLRSKLEKIIEEKFGFAVSVLLRSEKEIAALVKADPFKGVKVDKDTRLYITFLSRPAKAKLPATTKSSLGLYRVIDTKPGYLATVLQLGAKGGTIDLMEDLNKMLGEDITTRNWNTVLKIHKAMQA